MTVSPVVPTYVPDISSVAISPNALDANSIVSYCTSRLNALDDLIKERFADQQSRNAGIKEASALIASMNSSPTGLAEGAKYKDQAGNEVDARPFHRELGVSLANQYANATNPDVKAKILQTFQAVTGRPMDIGADGKPKAAMLDINANLDTYLDCGNIHAMDQTTWQAKVGDIKSMQDGLTKDNELSMISLQSVVSQRQLGVQMATQLLSTMSETAKQILNNLK